MFGIFRFILAVNVMIYHLLAIEVIGPYAVYSFFVLSGFLMTIIMNETYGYSLSGLKRYAQNRCLRLFPIYWFLLILILGVIWLVGEPFSTAYHPNMKVPDTISQWLANLFLVYPNSAPVNYDVRLSPPSWALSIELFFYLLIGIGITKTRTVSVIVFFASLIVAIYSIFGGNGLGYGTLVEASLPFSLGGILFHFRSDLKYVIHKLPSNCFLVVSSILLCSNLLFAIYLSDTLQPSILNTAVWKLKVLCVLSNMIISCFVIIGLYYFKPQNRFLKRLDRELGDLSYPLYIFHTAGGCIISWLLVNENINEVEESGVLLFSYSFIFTILVCWLSNFIINGRVEALRKRVKQSLVRGHT